MPKAMRALLYEPEYFVLTTPCDAVAWMDYQRFERLRLNMVRASYISKDHHHFEISINLHQVDMSLSRCARGNSRTPIDSLCRVFGIPSHLKPSTSSGASRCISRLHLSSRQVGLTSQVSFAARPIPRRTYESIISQSRAFSRSRPNHDIPKPTGGFGNRTMAQIKSRANLGVLKISYGQALFRGASHSITR
jgi:hypothetical protein